MQSDVSPSHSSRISRSAATTGSRPTSNLAPIQPTWKITASASIAFAASIEARIAAIDFT